MLNGFVSTLNASHTTIYKCTYYLHIFVQKGGRPYTVIDRSNIFREILKALKTCTNTTQNELRKYVTTKIGIGIPKRNKVFFF